MTAYHLKSNASLIELFQTLIPASKLEGVYIAELPGPSFLVPLKKFALTLSGLPNWQGKHFFGDYALNMCRKNGVLVAGPKMIIKKQAHAVDHQQGLVAVYEPTASFLWRHCTDEFRVIDQDTLLGMSYFDLPGARNKPMPFLLHKKNDMTGLASSQEKN